MDQLYTLDTLEKLSKIIFSPSLPNCEGLTGVFSLLAAFIFRET